MSEALSMEAFAAELSAASEPEAQAQEAATPEATEQPQGEETTAEGELEVEAQAETDPDPEAPDEPAEQPPGLSDDGEVEWETSAGEKFKVSGRELKDGYMRRQDYDHKAQALGEERRAAAAQVQQRMADAEAHAEDLAALKIVQTRLQEFAKVDWLRLQHENPQQFTLLMVQKQEIERMGQQALAAAQGRRAQLERERSESVEQQRAAEAKAAVDVLRKVTPGFGEKHVAGINTWLTSRGVTGDSLKNLTHPVLLEAVHKADMWDALQAKKPAVENRAKAVPPKAVGRAQTTQTTSKQAKAVAALESKKALSPREFAFLLANS